MRTYTIDTWDLVSIRTPTRGVIRVAVPDRRRQRVSIRTPTRGVMDQPAVRTASRIVSIRTPTRGVMCLAFGVSEGGGGFNPHPHAGGDS